jgi:hypothetical protein
MPNDDDSVDAKVLAALGQERLATLLAEVAMTNACMRRRLRFEVSAHNDEPSIDLAVRQWIDKFREQTSFFDAKQIGELAEELDAMRIAIASNVARAAPDLALDLMGQFFELARTIFERTTEEGWEVSQVFDRACCDMVNLSVNADIEPVVFARKVVAAIISDQYGEYGALVPAIASVQPPAPAYVYELKALLQRLQDQPPGGMDGSYAEHGHVLQRALRELDSPSAT